MTRLWLIVGLPGAGKTTRARALAEAYAAPRLTPDTWMIPLFGDSDADGLRDVLEGRLIWIATRMLQAGTNVVADFGFWTRDERASLHWLAGSVGADCRTVYLEIDRATQLERIRQRWQETPEHTYPMTEADVDGWRTQFEDPDADELAGRLPAAPPPGWTTWGDWIADRWPTSMDPAP